MNKYNFKQNKFNSYFTGIFFFIIIFFAVFGVVGKSLAVSDSFPPTATPPTVADFLSSPLHTYYCSPTGNNDTGNGSIGNPWLDKSYIIWYISLRLLLAESRLTLSCWGFIDDLF